MGWIQQIGSAVSATGVSTITVPVSTATSPGSLLVAIGFGNQAGNVTACTDTQSNTYVSDFAANVTTTAGRGLEIWRCAFPSPLTTADSLTINVSTAQDHGIVVIVDQMTYVAAPDVTSFSDSTTSVATLSDTWTLTANDNAAYTAICFNGAVTALTVGSPFTLTGAIVGITSGTGLDLSTAYNNSPTSGSTTATFSWTSSHTVVMDGLGYPPAPLTGTSTCINQSVKRAAFF